MGHVADELADRADAVLIAVADELLEELLAEGLVGEYPGLRQSIVDAVLTVGESTMTVVTLRYAPSRIRALAAWLHTRFSRATIEVNDVRRGLSFTVRGPAVSADAVAAFITSAIDSEGKADDRPKVFICYAHDSEDHKTQVRQFAGFLVGHGINATLDSWNLHERHDWQQWATEQITNADYVLVIASPRCRLVGDGNHDPQENRGLRSELNLVRELYHAQPDVWPKRIMPIVLPGHAVDEIPLFLQPNTADHYIITDFTVTGAEDLLRHLTKQPPYLPPEPGDRPVLSVRG